MRYLQAEMITKENFAAYGQVITATEDGKPYDQTDAKLDLRNGIPRFYIMQLHRRGRQFHRITRHSRCTQCLGSLFGKQWLLAVAPPSQSDRPNLEALRAFEIPGDCFIKLEIGTWHAGPYFDDESISFYNLELSDTNIVDHFTYDFCLSDRLEFEIIPHLKNIHGDSPKTS